MSFDEDYERDFVHDLKINVIFGFIILGIVVAASFVLYSSGFRYELPEIDQEHEEAQNSSIEQIRKMDCSELKNWMIEAKGTWWRYQTEASDIYKLKGCQL